jgi:hypothetical protein
MKTFVAYVFLLSLGVSAAQAQGGYSEAGEKSYIEHKDWRGLLRYNQA